MSSLIFYTDSKQALVATDTLAVHLDGKPFKFCSKAVYLPHLRTIVVGTGLAGFSNDWANDINNRFIVRGLRNLDYHTPKALRDQWSELSLSQAIPQGVTTTVYQIGVNEDNEEICAFAYRSTNDFKSEPLPHATFVKPHCKVVNSGNFEADVQTMMLEQRSIQENNLQEERIYIGGECILMHLSKDEFISVKLFQFHDYQETLREIFDAFNTTDN